MPSRDESAGSARGKPSDWEESLALGQHGARATCPARDRTETVPRTSPAVQVQSTVPEHVGVILELPLYRWIGLLAPEVGLLASIQSIKSLISDSNSLGIKTLFIWTLSLPRSLDLSYCQQRIVEETATLCRSTGMELAVLLSDQDPPAMAASAGNVNVFLTFDGKRQVVHALRRASQVMRDAPLTERDVEAHLTTGQYPALDLIIRTSPTKSMQGFMLWQSVRSEYWFHESWLPFSTRDFRAALRSFASRQRRYGA